MKVTVHRGQLKAAAFREHLTKVMKGHGMAAEQIADICGSPTKAEDVSAWLAGRSEPNQREVVRLTRGLGINVWDFIES